MFRKMRRFNQQTSEEEALELLKNGKRGVLAVLGDDGYPYAVPLNYVYDNGSLYFHSAMEGHKIDAVKNYDKASFCVTGEGTQEPNDWWYHFTSIIAFGKIRLLDTADEADAAKLNEMLYAMGRKYFPTEEEVEDDVQRNLGRTAMIELKIEHLAGKRVKEK